MEGRDSWRTLECLRGRLLAERQASKIAKEEAELMGNKVCFFYPMNVFCFIFSPSGWIDLSHASHLGYQYTPTMHQL